MILGIDTATSTGVVGIYEKEKGIRGEVTFRLKKGHGRVVNSFIDELFSRLELSPREISGVIVGIGPGSFTGTRVGITVARSLKLALNIPIWKISTLKAFVFNLGFTYEVPALSLLDARNERVYWGVYHREGEMIKTISTEKNSSLFEVGNYLGCDFPEIMVIGEFPADYPDKIKEKFQGKIIRPFPHQDQLRGGAIAYAGYLRSLENPRGDELEDIKPLYLKGPVGVGK